MTRRVTFAISSALAQVRLTPKYQPSKTTSKTGAQCQEETNGTAAKMHASEHSISAAIREQQYVAVCVVSASVGAPMASTRVLPGGGPQEYAPCAMPRAVCRHIS